MARLRYTIPAAKSIYLIVWAVTTLLSACRKPDIMLQGSKQIYVIGHGGTGFSDLSQYPPNSWTSVAEAIDRYGADGVEIDIQMSSDGVLFMYHDQHLDEASFCTGCLYEWSAQALTDCAFKPRSGKKADEFITPVERLLARYAAEDRRPLIFLDLKNPLACLPGAAEARDLYYRTALQEVYRLIEKYKATDWVMLQSDSREWLTYTRRHYPEIRVLLDYIKDTSDIMYAVRAGFYGVAAPSADLPAENIVLAHNEGLKVQLYGVRLQEDMVQALNNSPDYFLTDNIPLARRILAVSADN